MYVCVYVIFKMCMIFKIKMLNHDKTSRISAKKEKWNAKNKYLEASLIQ